MVGLLTLNRPWLRANLFNLRAGRVVDTAEEFEWEDLEEFDPNELCIAFCNNFYLDAEYLAKMFPSAQCLEDNALLGDLLTRLAGRNSGIFIRSGGTQEPSFGSGGKKRQSIFFRERFRVPEANIEAIGVKRCTSALNLPEEVGV